MMIFPMFVIVVVSAVSTGVAPDQLIMDGNLKKKRCNRNLIQVKKLMSDLLTNYDPYETPGLDIVNVTLELHVQEISSLSELDAEMELDVMYSEIWTDPRLSFRHHGLCVTNLTLKSDFREKIWTPSTCITNSKSSKIHQSPSNNTFLILYEDGSVWTNWRIKLRTPCRFQLETFPFDVQRCSLLLETYAYNSGLVSLAWDAEPVTLMTPVALPEFSLATWTTRRDQLLHRRGTSDQLRVTFVFTRRYGFYLLHAYFPTCFTVILSWLSFTYHPLNVSARINLGFSSFLALVFQLGTIQRHLPRFSSVKCLDVWLIACVIFVFTTLPVMSVGYYFGRKERELEMASKYWNLWRSAILRRRLRRKRQKYVTWSDTRPRPANLVIQTPLTVTRSRADPNAAPSFWHRFKGHFTTGRIDHGALVLFPLAFAAFNVIYWWIFIFENSYFDLGRSKANL